MLFIALAVWLGSMLFAAIALWPCPYAVHSACCVAWPINRLQSLLSGLALMLFTALPVSVCLCLSVCLCVCVCVISPPLFTALAVLFCFYHSN